MKITFLGTGTSHGIPVIGCSCPVCLSETAENKRYRSSILIEEGATSIVIDITPEFRLQALRAHIKSLDGVLLTHAHADHLHGIDDLRALSYKKHIPLYAKSDAYDEIMERFPYIFRPSSQGGGIPQIDLKSISSSSSFRIGSLKITPIECFHGKLKILAYRIGNFAYMTDCSKISDESMEALKGVNTLVVGALRYKKHDTHFNIDEALELIKKISPKRAYLTHLSHDLDHIKLNKELPGSVEPARDGLILNIKL